jgi:hypothetical protein
MKNFGARLTGPLNCISANSPNPSSEIEIEDTRSPKLGWGKYSPAVYLYDLL